MSHLNDKVSYLRGLMEGMKLDTSRDESTLISKIIDVLDSMASEITDLCDAQEELGEYIDSVDQDLSDLESIFEDDEDEDEEDEEDDDDEEDFDEENDEEYEGCDGECESCPGRLDEEDGDDYDGEIYVECMCPECKGTFYVREEELGDDVFHICPRCGAKIHVVPDYEDDIPVASLADDSEDQKGK